jgi:beta-lactamase class A
MFYFLKRRVQKTATLLFLSFFLLIETQPANAYFNSAQKEFATKVEALEKQNGGRLGVAVVSLNGTPLLLVRETERFAMCSTFKALLGAAVLARVDAGSESLGRLISYKESDLLEYAPITKDNLSAGAMTIAELNEASIQYSDNTAANLLLDAIGGPAELTKFLRSLGDNTTRLDRNEPTLNTNLDGDDRDTSTPVAMAISLQKLLRGDVLSLTSTEQLKAWMFGNTTGATRLKAGFNKDWLIGDKTGTGPNGAVNDVAIVFPRGLPPFAMVVFFTGSKAASEVKNSVIAEVARITERVLMKHKFELKLQVDEKFRPRRN